MNHLRVTHGESISAAAKALAEAAEEQRRATEDLIDSLFGGRSPARVERGRKRKRRAAAAAQRDADEDLFGSSASEDEEGEEGDKGDGIGCDSDSSLSDCQLGLDQEDSPCISGKGYDKGAAGPLDKGAAGPLDGPSIPTNTEMAGGELMTEDIAANGPSRPASSTEDVAANGSRPSVQGGGPERAPDVRICGGDSGGANVHCVEGKSILEEEEQGDFREPPEHPPAATDAGTPCHLSKAECGARMPAPHDEGGVADLVTEYCPTGGSESATDDRKAEETKQGLALSECGTNGRSGAVPPPLESGKVETTSRVRVQTTEFVKAVLDPMLRAQVGDWVGSFSVHVCLCVCVCVCQHIDGRKAYVLFVKEQSGLDCQMHPHYLLLKMHALIRHLSKLFTVRAPIS